MRRDIFVPCGGSFGMGALVAAPGVELSGTADWEQFFIPIAL